MVCPRCERQHSEEVDYCPCGHNFETQPMQNAPLERFSMFGTTFRGATIIESPASDDAKRHITRSFIAAGIVPSLLIICLFLAESDMFASIALIGITAYMTWASYWGIVGVMRTVTDLGEREMPEGFLGDLIVRLAAEGLGLGGMVLVAPIALGILYGILGGGVHEFLDYRRIAKNPGLALK